MDFVFFASHEFFGPRGRRGEFVAEDEEAWVAAEVVVDVFEGAAGGFRVEEVGEGDEGEVEDGPDYVESFGGWMGEFAVGNVRGGKRGGGDSPPCQGVDADWCDFDDHAFVLSVEGAFRTNGERLYKLKIQLVAVPISSSSTT